MITLHGYWRSSAAYRVRIALNLKGLSYHQVPVHLAKNGGEQHSASFVALNPAGLVPVLVDDDLVIHQSMAILDYLEHRYSEVPLLPRDLGLRSLAFAIAQDIACDIHPLDNLRVMVYLKTELGVDERQTQQWYRHWIDRGFAAIEKRIERSNGTFCVGDQPTWADICLVPQVYNARRFDIPLDAFPKLSAVVDRCQELEPFQRAAPEAQPDAEPT